MKLYMKQKVFSWKDRFTIMDSFGEDKYFVEGEFLSIGKKLHITDKNGREAAFVKQKLIALMPKFTIEIDGREIAEIVKKLTLFTPKYIVKGLGWEVEGDFFAHDYVIKDGSRIIVSIHKQWMSWGDTFELDVDSDENEVVALAVVLAIDAVMDANASSAASSSF
ncbi:MAG: LURP-one-related family protein [Eubacterium sp.]|nr:LURP-one-related family protein [Eubacterium sp.]